VLSAQNADLCFLQETDLSSKRSYYINEVDYFSGGLTMGSAFAYNFRCPYVPYPWPTIGKVESGLTTLSNLAVTKATRESLPVPFSWPMRVANLKRCLLVERLPIQDSDKSLVLVNLHMEAYSSQEGRQKQMEQLSSLIAVELAGGNYVIAGGDFNQSFPGAVEKYPLPENPVWEPGQLAVSDLPEGFAFAFDMSVPTCRSLDAPYDGNRDTLVAYVIDGFIVSSNVKVNSVETVDLNFRNTDHQPVAMEFTLQ
jgi:endonuclease/exonuclease/phosphatase family metal-dependent hydrolase